MNKIAFVFPGQGSQYVGMTKDLFENNPKAKEMFDEAEKLLGFDIKKICHDGPETELKQTVVTQPAIFLHSIILTELFSKIKPDMVAGHSLGEYTALAVSGTLSYQKALELVALRGKFMDEAGKNNPGMMAAIIGLNSVEVSEICNASSNYGIVQPANYNLSDQVVISGSITGVKKAMELAKTRGAKLVKELAVSCAFHSPLMKSAEEAMAGIIEKTEFLDPKIPIYVNVDAKPKNDVKKIKYNLTKQITSPVLWNEIIKNMEQDGAETFIEIGPGQVLQKLIKKICPGKKVFGIDLLEDIGNIEKQLLAEKI